MNPSVTSEHTHSVWMGVEMPTARTLNEDIATEVCIIGSGIAGLTTAYRLLQEGKSVVVLESGTLGSGMTPLTTAHLSHVMDRGLSTIERLHGEQGTRLAVRSHTAAIEWIEDTAAKESIPCGFERVDGYLFAPFDSPAHQIEEEWAAARRAGGRRCPNRSRARRAVGESSSAARHRWLAGRRRERCRPPPGPGDDGARRENGRPPRRAWARTRTG